ncbi:MAG: acetyl-CoA carboxylase biotin carboxyl carrier protein [Candidatus Omnitrophica bacterium]|nr:acetyl-CoA carboxylase biotin carboxyl carrier protein [Candidatus Omnitrophota bacterium]
MDLEKLNKFIKFMDDNNLAELEIEEEGKRIKLKKALGQQPVLPLQGFNQPVPESKDAETVKTSSIEIHSPMVGTFYRAPSPGAKPYVEIGDVIKPGDVVCIIEAMKLMNEIKAEVGGKILQIPIENGEPVEFGQILFTIEPA